MKKILFSLLTPILFFVTYQIKAQVINEGFEEADWATSAASTNSVVTVNVTGTGSINNGTWSYKSANVQTAITRTSSKSLFVGSSTSGYIITPVISGGVASVKVWVYANGTSSTLVVGAATNTAITATTGSITSTAAGNAFASSTFGTANGLVVGSWVQVSFTTDITAPAFVKIQRTANNFYLDDIEITSPVSGPSLSSSPSSVVFGNQQSGTNSVSQTVSISGSSLTGFPGSLTITAPSTDFQVSSDNSSFGATATIPFTAATLAATNIYIRFTPQSLGAKSGNVTVAGGGATTINIAVSGTGSGAIYNYRSKQSGNWADASTWQYNNGSWVDAVAAPTVDDGTISIQTGHVVTVAANASLDETTIDNGGSLVVASGVTLTVANGAGSDLTINGIFKNSGTTTLTGTIALGSTAVYQHDVTTAIPTLTWTTGSTCLVTGGTGVPATGGFGQTFSNLTWNCTNQSTQVVLGSTGFTVSGQFNVISTGTGGLQMISSSGVTNAVVGSYNQTGGWVYVFPNTSARSLTSNGDFMVSGGAFGITGQGGSGSGTLNVKGNLNVNGTGVISKLVGTTANLVFNGTTAQTINTTAVTDTFNVTFNNAAGITLNSPYLIKGNATFTSGIVNASATNYLAIAGASTVSGASATSFVNGPLVRILESSSPASLSFPIGKGAAYTPVVLNVTQDAATATSYTAEMIATAPTTNTLPSTLSKVSDTRHYNISKGAGANVTSASVQLNYDVADASVTGVSVTDKALIRIAKDNGAGAWVDLGAWWGGSSNNSGTAISDINFTSFSKFVIANSTTAIVPLKFVAFNAKNVEGKVKLNWQVAEELNVLNYSLERLTANNLYETIALINATNAANYSSTDVLPKTGTNVYRIKATDKDGKVTYSQSIKVTVGKLFASDVVVAPNPIKGGQMNLQIMNYETGIYAVKLIDNSGRIVYKKQISVTDGSNVISLQLSSSVVKGVYQLIMANENTITSKQVVVE